MNCRQLEENVLDLVGGACEDAFRAQALEHARTCPRCSSLLSVQQSLSAALKLAASDGPDAPGHLETALLWAYRRRPQGTGGQIRQFPAQKARGLRYMGIAAALLVAVLGIVAVRMLRTPLPDQARELAPATKAPAPAVPLHPSAETRAEQGAAKQAQQQTASAVKPAPKPARRAIAKAAPEVIEVATDFFALTSAGDLNSMESGQLVRVQLPRNAMASYGLPVNQERLDKPVTAQVLIGQDGVARAIRFLSEPDAGFVPAGMRSKR